MMRMLVVLCALALAGCMPSATTVVSHHYTLGASAAPVPGAHPPVRAASRILRIARIDVPPWLAGSVMHYRLAYRGDGELAAYAHSDWAAPPASLLEPLVQHVLAAGGHWRAVVGPANPAVADVGLHLRLQDFSQVFAQPGQSSGNLEATATLVDEADQHVIAQKHFHIEVAAASADAQGGARALGTASRHLARQLAAWLQTTIANSNAAHS